MLNTVISSFAEWTMVALGDSPFVGDTSSVVDNVFVRQRGGIVCRDSAVGTSIANQSAERAITRLFETKETKQKQKQQNKGQTYIF